MVNYLFIPLMIGVLGVLQNTWNRQISQSLGIPIALIVNNLVLLACSLILFAIIKMLPANSLPNLFYEKEAWLSTINWKNLLPGIAGILIIATAPVAIEKAGALKVFLGIIVAQIIMSIIWDYFVEEIPATPLRLAGALVTIIGAFLATR